MFDGLLPFLLFFVDLFDSEVVLDGCVEGVVGFWSARST